MSSHPKVRRAACAAALVAISLVPVWNNVRAQGSWDFIPTPEEYAAWPEYCRVQFTLHGQLNQVVGGVRYPAGTIDSLRRVIGVPFEGLHHYCASIHFLNRSRVASEATQKQFLLNRAVADLDYSMVRNDTGSPVFPDMAVVASQIRLEQNKAEEALAILKTAITAQPARLEPYVALSLVQRKLGQMKLARDALLEADKISNGKSMEVQYNLGLINLELGDTRAAVENAKKAYGMGYPLPGLKRRLERAGFPIDGGN
jgi:tetratricopeptide (TPR) repeat protein